MKAKRILASVLACLVLMMSMTALASAETTATGLPTAVNGVITLKEDVTLATKVVVSETLTIEGNGHTLTYTGSDRAITVENTAVADLTINNLNVVCSANSCQRGINYNTTGSLTLNNVSVSGTNVTYGVSLPGSSIGATVAIADSDITAKIAINIWGANSVINVTDTYLTSVDNVSYENYAAISLNKDSYTAAEGAVVTVTGGIITAYDEKGEPSNATINGTTTGTITISDATVVNGTEETIVAIVDYGTSDVYSCTSLQAAVNKAGEDGATVKLLKNIELTEKITVNNAVTIDGQGYKVTTSAKNLFEVYADFSVSDLKMESTNSAGRCVNTRVDGITVLIDNCELVTKGSGWAQALTIGGTDEDSLTVTVTDSKIESSYVSIIMFVPANLTISGSELSGYGTVYAKGIDGNTTGSVITIEDSVLTSKNTHSGSSNSFAAIFVEDEGVDVTVDAASTIAVEATTDAKQAAISLSNKASAATIECTVIATGNNAAVLSNINNASLTVTNENVIAAVKDAGYNVAADGKVSVPTATWMTDTDAGYYFEEETKYGLLRFLFSAEIDGEILESGIKYIKVSNIADKNTADGVIADANGASAFYGDINGIPETEAGKKIAAVAYVKTAVGTYWSDAVVGTVDMTSQQFTDYVAGGAQ